MIERIVRLTLDPNRLEEFLELFWDSYALILERDGCESLRLLQNTRFPNQVTTHSVWQSEDALRAYRQSELFTKTWALAKEMFAARAEATSYVVHTAASS